MQAPRPSGVALSPAALASSADSFPREAGRWGAGKESSGARNLTQDRQGTTGELGEGGRCRPAGVARGRADRGSL